MAQKITLKLRRILLRVLFLALLALLAVGVSVIVLEQLLIKNALVKEADYFWNRYEQNGSSVPPDTWNLKSLFVDGEHRLGSIGEIDTSLFIEEQSESFVHVIDKPGYILIYKTQRDDKQLYLLFNGENVRNLAFFLGIIPLTLFLLLSYLVGFLFYRRATKALSPIIWLADKFDQFDPLSKNLPEFNLDEMPQDADWETSVLANSLGDYLVRIKEFVGRERAFTRDVSHELRTPLTVMGMALSMLETDGKLNKADAKAVQRIRNASTDMRELVEVFLILARESSEEMGESDVWLAEVVEREIDKNLTLLDNKPVKINVINHIDFKLQTSEKILEVLLGNLIRNAMLYTEKGSINVEINTDIVVIQDTGVGMSEEQLQQVYKPFFRGGSRPSGGHGVGLTIVKRIADRFDWQLEFESELAVGTKVTVKF